MFMISIVIQAGGRSTRMGQDKGLVPLAGIPMIEHVLSGVKNLGDEIIITTNAPEYYAYLNLRMVRDKSPGEGALAGLQTALGAADGSTVFVIACDMPFPNKKLINHLFSLASSGDAIVPYYNDRYQPLHAVYSKRPCLSAIKNALDKGEKKVISFYSEIDVITVDETIISALSLDNLSFFNVNTPSELEKAELIISQKNIKYN